MKRITGIIALVLILTAASVQAITVYYKPTPYPLTISSDKQHIVDGWITNVYYDKKFMQDDKLQIGGWGDLYQSYLKFDLTGLPENISQAIFWIMPSQVPSPKISTPFAVCPVTSFWDNTMIWSTRPSAPICYGWYMAPTPDRWWGLYITNWYTGWKKGTMANYGLKLTPQFSNNNNFDMFRSSRYTDVRWKRPFLQLNFTPPVAVPDFKIPLPGELYWLVTTEVGGYDCLGDIPGNSPWPDTAHQNNNYFSIDFSWKNFDANWNQRYDPNYSDPAKNNIPILAAANGKVAIANDDLNNPNGYYVVIDHDDDVNVGTGFSTRYLHLKYAPNFTEGQYVSQGDIIGYMGNTGLSNGVHLHFGVRYNNNGDANTFVSYVVMDGFILKSFQTECSIDSNGQPKEKILYYPSTNRAY